MTNIKSVYIKLVLAAILGGFSGYFVNYFYYILFGQHLVNKSSLIDIFNTEFTSNLQSDDVLTPEYLVTSFEYISNQPRMYSKYMQKMDSSVYDISLSYQAIAAMSTPSI